MLITLYSFSFLYREKKKDRSRLRVYSIRCVLVLSNQATGSGSRLPVFRQRNAALVCLCVCSYETSGHIEPKLNRRRKSIIICCWSSPFSRISIQSCTHTHKAQQATQRISAVSVNFFGTYIYFSYFEEKWHPEKVYSSKRVEHVMRRPHLFVCVSFFPRHSTNFFLELCIVFF